MTETELFEQRKMHQPYEPEHSSMIFKRELLTVNSSCSSDLDNSLAMAAETASSPVMSIPTMGATSANATTSVGTNGANIVVLGQDTTVSEATNVPISADTSSTSSCVLSPQQLQSSSSATLPTQTSIPPLPSPSDPSYSVANSITVVPMVVAAAGAVAATTTAMTVVPLTVNSSTYSSSSSAPSSTAVTALGSTTASAAAAAAAPIQAYAKIESAEFSYFVRKLEVVLGRQVAENELIDVHVGGSKSISRKHAKIQFNFSLQSFEIVVMGKNGAIIDGQFVACLSTPTPLHHRSTIVIGDVECHFLLPNQGQDTHNHPYTNDHNDPHQPPRKRTKVSSKQQISRHTSLQDIHSKNVKLQSQTSSAASKFVSGDDGPEEERPNISYATMISQAILSTGPDERKMTLADIYRWISENYPYYKLNVTGWQNSIRHNLSLNRAFKKVPREEPGKGGWWTLDSDYEYVPATRRRPEKGGGGGASTTTSQ